MFPASSTRTLPATFALNTPRPPGLKPAWIPEGALPELFAFAPDEIVPSASTVTVLAAAAATTVAWFPALIPVPPESILEPNAVLTVVLPVP